MKYHAVERSYRWCGGFRKERALHFPFQCQQMKQQLQQMKKKKTTQIQQRKRGTYLRYDEETRAKIAKYLCENRNRAAVTKHSAELGHVVTESTVRNYEENVPFSTLEGKRS